MRRAIEGRMIKPAAVRHSLMYDDQLSSSGNNASIEGRQKGQCGNAQLRQTFGMLNPSRTGVRHEASRGLLH